VRHLHVELVAESLLESHIEVLLSPGQAAAENVQERPHSGDVGGFQGVVALNNVTCKVDL